MPITLENRGRHMQVFNLPHEPYCEKSGRCGCAQEIVNTWVEDAATGERTLRSKCELQIEHCRHGKDRQDR